MFFQNSGCLILSHRRQSENGPRQPHVRRQSVRQTRRPSQPQPSEAIEHVENTEIVGVYVRHDVNGGDVVGGIYVIGSRRSTLVENGTSNVVTSRTSLSISEID